MYVYVLMPYNDWQEFKNTGKLDNYFDECEQDFLNWLKDQMKTRECSISDSDIPIYAYSEKPPLWYKPLKRVICKVLVNESDFIEFDERMYIHTLNCFNNKMDIFTSVSEAEDNEKINANHDECMESYERMFDKNLKRDHKWCGKYEKRIFISSLSRNMIQKVWVYRGSKRLRKH